MGGGADSLREPKPFPSNLSGGRPSSPSDSSNPHVLRERRVNAGPVATRAVGSARPFSLKLQREPSSAEASTPFRLEVHGVVRCFIS